MKKIVLYLIIVFVLANFSIAEKVFVLDLHYENEKISVVDRMVKNGYHPDRRIQPDEGILAEVISTENSILYSFNFEVPLVVYTDVIDNFGEIDGGIIILNETDFSLVVPYFENAKEIRFYDEGKDEILSANLAPAFSPNNIKKIVQYSFIGLIALIIIILFFRRKKD